MSKKVDEYNIYDLFRHIYPERFVEEDDETFNEVQDFLEDINSFCEEYKEYKFFQFQDFMTRILKLAPVYTSAITVHKDHCLGIQHDNGFFEAIITLPAEEK